MKRKALDKAGGVDCRGPAIWQKPDDIDRLKGIHDQAVSHSQLAVMKLVVVVVVNLN